MSFMKKSKGGGIDTKGANEQRDQAISELFRTTDEAGNLLTEGQNRFNPLESQNLFNRALGRYNNFDADAKIAEDNAYNANYKPILNEIQSTLGNQFAGMGSAGRNNSRGQYAQAVSANNLADTAGQRLLGIRQSARNQLMDENQGLLSPATSLLQQISGFDTNKANLRAQVGQNAANTRLGFQSGINSLNAQNAQMQAQKRSQDKAGMGSLIGGGISLASSAFSDERLKENIKPVGKLDNGLTVYAYNFIGSPKTEIGLIAQEVQKVKPEAVHKHVSGFLKVQYKEAVK